MGDKLDGSKVLMALQQMAEGAPEGTPGDAPVQATIRMEPLQWYKIWLECGTCRVPMELVGETWGNGLLSPPTSYEHQCPKCLAEVSKPLKYPYVGHEPGGGK